MKGLERERLVEIGERLVHLETTGSTNDEAMALANRGAPHGTVVVADEQSAGRGRRGASWCCEPGKGLAFSVVVRPGWKRARWGWLGLATGLAVAEVLEQRDFEAAVKWPNDVLLAGRKVCGVLVEAVPDAAAVGIGLNVNEERFPDGIEATSLRQAGGREIDREDLLVETWQRLLAVLDRDPDLIAEAAWSRLAWRDQPVESGSGVQGTIRGFGEDGQLILESEDGLVRLTEGESLRATGFRG